MRRLQDVLQTLTVNSVIHYLQQSVNKGQWTLNEYMNVKWKTFLTGVSGESKRDFFSSSMEAHLFSSDCRTRLCWTCCRWEERWVVYVQHEWMRWMRQWMIHTKLRACRESQACHKTLAECAFGFWWLAGDYGCFPFTWMHGRCWTGPSRFFTRSLITNKSSVQSLDWLGCRRNVRDDSAEILFQSFLQEALVSSGMPELPIAKLMAYY